MRVTVALAMTLPAASLTTPLSDVLLVCASAKLHNRSSKQIKDVDVFKERRSRTPPQYRLVSNRPQTPISREQAIGPLDNRDML